MQTTSLQLASMLDSFSYPLWAGLSGLKPNNTAATKPFSIMAETTLLAAVRLEFHGKKQ